MNSVSGSFEDFIEQFKKRHAKEYAGERQATPQTVAHSPIHSPTKLVNAPEKPVPVPKAAVVEEDWDAAEVVEAEESGNWWDK